MKHNKKLKKYISLLKKDEDFDYSYLLVLERHKLTRMIDSFTNAKHKHIGIEYNIRDMQICVNLIDIILEEDRMSKIFLQQFGKIQFNVDENHKVHLTKIDVKIPCHINHKNAYRFNKSWFGCDIPKDVYMEIRRLKALYLYNKIRCRMLSWWW